MTVTIGTFSTKNLKAQPFGYEGNARNGRTAEILEFSGLLRPSEWLDLKGVYDTWRSTRINDPDTLGSKVVGTTVGVSASANGVTWSNKACWFTEAPSATQVGALVEVSATLIDANQALNVLLKEETNVDCGVIQTNLEKRKDETDCEIAALSGGLADDFAAQDVTLELINRTAELAAKASTINNLIDLDYQFEVQEKNARKAVIGYYATTIAGLDADIEILQLTGNLAGRETRVEDLAELGYLSEIQEKTAQRNVIDTYATTIAELDLDLEVSQSTATKNALDLGKKTTIFENQYDTEILETQADIDALIVKMSSLKSIRQLRELYDKELSEDLPSLGNQTLGSATIKLLEPMESRIETPSFELTATGNAMISGPLKSIKIRNINGIITSGTRTDVLNWYDSTVIATPGTGALFPAGPPEFSIESVLVAGAKGSRTIVQITVIEIP